VRAIMASEVLRGEEHRSAVQALKPRSGIQVSFQCADTIAGALSLWYTRPGRSYREEDCNIAVRLAEAAGAALGNAQSYGRQGRAAEGLQRHLVPHSLPLVAGLDLAACYCPADGEARVGGDFYDVFPTRGPAWALMIGDVMGHGAEVASAATIARHVMRAMATRISTPSRVLAGLNATLMGDAENELLCSAEYVRLEWNEEGARVMVASGGHPLPILLRAGTAYAIGLTGLLLGMQDDYTAPDFVLQLRPGDALVLYTDGVTEARCGREMLGEDRLLEILRSCAGRSAREIVECIQREVIRFRNDFRKDDLAVLVMRLAEQI